MASWSLECFAYMQRQTATNLLLDVLTARRDKEKPGLQFLALICFLQVLMKHNFVIENSGASKIIKESPLQILVQLGLHVTKLDQCMYGAEHENRRIRKHTMFVFDCEGIVLKWPRELCSCSPVAARLR